MLSASEFALLDELYFLTSFQELQQRLNWSENEVSDVLSRLQAQNLIQQFQFSKNRNDYLLVDPADQSLFRNSFFVASREGLLKHMQS